MPSRAPLQLEARPAPDETIAELKQLHIARDALVKDRTAAKNRAKAITLALLKRQNADRLKHIERQISAITAIMRKLIVMANALLKARRHWMPKTA